MLLVDMTSQATLRSLPSVDKLLNTDVTADLIAHYGRENVVNTLRAILADVRAQVFNGNDHIPDIVALAADQLAAEFTPTLRPVINATGIILHTNLGRALLSKAAQHAVLDVAGQYNTLEFNLESGKRGSRYLHAEELLKTITGAEAALVVNNNAAALVLLLAALAHGKSVIVSRGQLVEIGGGFRIPEIMAQSGATLVEVGTTNRTRINDFTQAINANTALLMRIHSSNFRQIGFVEQPELADLADAAHEKNLWLVDDVGSGALLDTSRYGLEKEPQIQESIAAGADLVAFSGDKLLGGPQAGILVGKKIIIETLKKHPLARALRADKLCYAALGATLEHYRKNEAVQHIPVWQMIARPIAELQHTAQRWQTILGGDIIASESAVGGGSLPGDTLPTVVLALTVNNPDTFMAQLRAAEMPIIARIAEGRILFDPRTVLAEQEDSLLNTVSSLQGEIKP
jgi:L-seryl-tRNA(Ser) seleniumtransferase